MLCGRSQLPIKLRIYTVFVFLSAFCFPMVIIILSYLELVKSVQSVRHDVIHYGNQGRSSRSDFMLKSRVSKICQIFNVCTSLCFNLNKRLIILLISSYVICWIPLQIFQMMKVFDSSLLSRMNCESTERILTTITWLNPVRNI